MSSSPSTGVRTDEDLIGAVRAGDRDSLGILVARWEQPLFRFVYRILPSREEAQDVCQETFVRILKKSHRFRDGGRFSTWMYQIALNLCRDQLRRHRRSRRVFAPEPPDDRRPAEAGKPEPGPLELVRRRERRKAVARALERIPSEQREVLVMKEYEGLRFREIAQVLGCPESTVKSRMYYGLRGLRTALIELGFDDLEGVGS